ncbi:glycosyl transferase family 1 [Halobacteriales archaeon QS_4_69_31]|nr:MAG: glycosyl transferase family 1 [Halobacteriales archaeon QS_4_69_31]
MKVSHYFEWEDAVTGGFAQSVSNQRKILDRHGIEYTTDPTTDADLLHLNNTGPRSVYWAKRARRAGVPVVAHTHNTAADFRDSFVFSNVLAYPLKPWLAYAYSQADHLVCPSGHNQAVVAEYTDTPSTVISNGFDAERFAGYDDPGLRREYLDRYGLEPPVVFMFGHVIKRKGLRTFVETARAMPAVDFAWFGYVNPTGGRLDRFLQPRETRKLVAESPDNCAFTGYIKDPRGAVAAGDVLFWPSTNENEGMALLEAMHCGKPPVIRSIPTYDWLEDGVNCLKATDEFVEPLQRLCADDQLRERIGSAAAETSEQFSLEAVGEKLVALYERLV